MKFKRIFLIVCDSLGCGSADDSNLFFQDVNGKKIPDTGANTIAHISYALEKGLNVPTLEDLGIGFTTEIKGVTEKINKNSIVARLVEQSKGKDTMTGHWEMMGINTEVPFKTFTETGFPQELMDEISEKTGYKLIGNCAASGTQILVDLGEQSMKEKSLIVYTSADSVIQIAAHEEVVPVEELYRVCEIVREIVNRPEYLLGRVIARPFIGTDRTNFKRTPNRHDLALSPSDRTSMDELMKSKLDTICVGKISDIFNGVGVSEKIKTVSNEDGMNKTIDLVKNRDFKGLCFVNLVEFDSEFGHRRNAEGYGKSIEEFDVQLKEFISNMKDDDLLLVTADHGNDPTWVGTDHTREKVMLIAYSKSLNGGKFIGDIFSFGSIGKTILHNFDVKPSDNQVGKVIEEYFK